MIHKWWNDPTQFEQMRQNFTSNLRVNGPNMNLPDMSEKLCEMRRDMDRMQAALEDISEDIGYTSGEWHQHCRQIAIAALATPDAVDPEEK